MINFYTGMAKGSVKDGTVSAGQLNQPLTNGRQKAKARLLGRGFPL